ncbi:hypothetical protein FHP29_11700 [Nocardioides albidus]|uniref:Uncharacterized protein n=1 Tax=Nocardioides albidus TaxID=1517589 RepID=A0A5C4VUD9_9ACTN|nr:hypothetical protein [Nocardioides albidus]TNM39542.1 hypothetical protein FHP29_11700 [Nocardioides albidus]
MPMRMCLRALGTALAALFALLLSTGPALADSPHFVSASLSTSGFGLTATFKEAGLGSGTTVTITLNASYDAVFQCINGGRKNPSASNKTTISGDATASGQFTSGKNGNVNGSLTLSAPSADSNGFSCPKGQTETLTQITWSDVSLVDATSGASETFPGTWTFGQAL